MARMVGVVCTVLVLVVGLVSPVAALPSGFMTPTGYVSAREVGTTMTITSTADVAIAYFNEVSVGAGETLRIVQPSPTSLLVLLVVTDSTSQVDGTVEANGQLVIMNPWGIVVGNGAQVEASSLVLTSTSFTAETIAEFAVGIVANRQFSSNGEGDSTYVDAGATITATAGSIALISGEDVENRGSLVAAGGSVSLISAGSVAVDMRAQPTFTPSSGPDPGPPRTVFSDIGSLIRAPDGAVEFYADSADKLGSNGGVETNRSTLHATRLSVESTSVGRIDVTCELRDGALTARVLRNGLSADPTRPALGRGTLWYFDRRYDEISGGTRMLRVNAVQHGGAYDWTSPYGALACSAGVFAPGTPQISGTPTVGNTLTVKTGVWQPAPTSYRYQWLRDGSPISGATGANYVLTNTDEMRGVSVRLTGAKPGYENAVAVSSSVSIAAATSDNTAATGSDNAATAGKPVKKAKVFTRTPKPKISGKHRVGKRLTAKPGKWKPKGAHFTYQWSRGNHPIKKATHRRYTVKPRDAGRRLSVTVTAAKKGFATVTKTSTRIKIRQP